MANELQQFPDKDNRDFGYRVAKSAVGVIPFIGGPLQEILEMAVGLPSAKRQAEWFRSVAEVLQDVCNRVDGLTPENLGQNEEFQSVVASATEIAMRNHRQEKLEALRNIVKHTAEGLKIDEVLRNSFLSLVDRFSPLHIVVLRLHHNPSSSPEIVAKAKSMMTGGFRHLLVAALPNCSEEVLNQIEADLAAERLIHPSGGMATMQGLMTSHSTTRGTAFLQFIS
jgi:hypothetical protein